MSPMRLLACPTLATTAVRVMAAALILSALPIAPAGSAMADGQAAAPRTEGAAPPPPRPTGGTQPPLLAAAAKGDVAALERLFLQGENLNQTNEKQQTALHFAAENGRDAAIEWLIAREANIFLRDDSGRIPSDLAWDVGNRSASTILKKFKFLLNIEQIASMEEAWEELADALTRDCRRYTLLHVLAIRGNEEEARRRIEAGAVVDARTVLGMTPLMYAAGTGRPGVASLLLRSGADVNARDVLDNTPLIAAVASGNEEVVRLFLEAGADLRPRSRNARGTALELAEMLHRDRIAAMLRAARPSK